MNIDIKTADGEEIELGGAYYDGRGTEYKAVGVRLVDYRRIVNVSLSCLTGKVDKLCCVSMRPNELYSTPPDSWEKLEEDLDAAGDARYQEACAYFHRDKDEDGCTSCPGGEDGCGRIAMRDIASRIRKLRGDTDADMRFAGWTAAGPMRGKDLPTSLIARARISSVLGELVSGA